MHPLAVKTVEKLDSITFDELLGQSDPFVSAECRFDLSEVRWVSPAGLVQLAAACHALKRDGHQPVVVIPSNSVRSYMCRAGWVSVVRGVARLEPVSLDLVIAAIRNQRGGNPMLLEVTKIDSGGELPELLDKIVWVLQHRLRYAKYDAFDVATAVSEVYQNTFEHSTKTCGFLAMQVYGDGVKRFVEIGFSDYDDGVLRTLTRNPKYDAIKDDGNAILTAAELGTSQFDDRTRGTGLYHLLQITRKHEGSVQIRSGRATARFRWDKKKGWVFPVALMPGVQVALTLRAKSAA